MKAALRSLIPPYVSNFATTTFLNISGRDIKELLRLTGRFVSVKNIPLTIEAFIFCAQFRGINIFEGVE